jgi:hypothetical protein
MIVSVDKVFWSKKHGGRVLAKITTTVARKAAPRLKLLSDYHVNVSKNIIRKRMAFIERSGIKRRATEQHLVGIGMLKAYPSAVFIDFMTNLIKTEIREKKLRPTVASQHQSQQIRT